MERTVFCWAHSSRIYVHIGIDLYRRNLETCRLEEEARGGR